MDALRRAIWKRLHVYRVTHAPGYASGMPRVTIEYDPTKYFANHGKFGMTEDEGYIEISSLWEDTGTSNGSVVFPACYAEQLMETLKEMLSVEREVKEDATRFATADDCGRRA